MTTLCALMLMFDAVLHDDDCDFIHLFDIRRMALLLIINVRNAACCHRVSRYIKLYFKVMIICVKELFLNVADLLLGPVLCTLFLPGIYVTRKVILLLKDHIVRTGDDRVSYIVNETTLVVPPHNITKQIVTMRGFEGEDMEMFHPNTDDEVTWLFNGEPVNESSRLYSFRQDTRNGSFHFLMIHSLQHGDFGTYSFVVRHLNITAYELVKRGVIELRNEFVLYLTLCEIILLEDVQREEKVMVPHGGLLKAEFSSTSFDDHEYLYVDMTVNGQPMELVCNQGQEGCSFSLHYFAQGTRTQVRHLEVGIHHPKLVYVISQTCMCPAAFGNHSLSYFRRRFNHDKGIFEPREIQSRKTYIVQPLRSPFLNWTMNVLGWHQPKAVSNTMNIYTLQEISLYSHAVELFVFIFLALLFLMPICLAVLYFLIFVLLIIMSLYIVHVSINTPRINKSRTTQTYILCCEEDTRWSVMNLNPVIKAVGHATYIHYRDSNPGQTELEGFRTGMTLCQTFVIVESQCAVQDPMWVHQVLIVLDRLVRREVPSFNVLVVRLDGARHPDLEDVISVRSIRTIVWEEGNSQDQYVQARHEDVM
ncbi:uncharacterized protein [Haliotis asinina]|uniref:uncharacterized protein n=1 Tax=Haliotis asinina TaxID=109174 RepID=UPI003532233A